MNMTFPPSTRAVRIVLFEEKDISSNCSAFFLDLEKLFRRSLPKDQQKCSECRNIC